MNKEGRQIPRHFTSASAFTLIELLVVVAIIAILAALAVPNFLEAQTRAKVSRVKSDLRTVATALEAYRTDMNRYPPNDGVYNVLPVQLTTPVAFLTTGLLVDPFLDKVRIPPRPGLDPALGRFYTYTKIISAAEFENLLNENAPLQPSEGIDTPDFNIGALRVSGFWRLASNGPDRKYAVPGAPRDAFNPNPLAQDGCDIPYDPTNGTISAGNILRTQISSEGVLPAF